MLHVSEPLIALSRLTEKLLGQTVQHFGYDRLSDEQNTLIRASVAGEDVLGILPTGSGKSACFQIPGMVTKQKSLIVSPLIALQEDQIAALRQLGIKAFALHSGMEETRKRAVHFYFKNAPLNEPSFLYLSPELLMTEMFHHRFDGVGFQRIAVDEAHCVSTWGNSFRPDYQRIRVATMRLQIAQCSAFTATVDPRIEADIKKRTPLRPGFRRVAASPMRENLILKVENPVGHLQPGQKGRGKIKFRRLLTILPTANYNGASIVYFSSRNQAVDVFEEYRRLGSVFHKKKPSFTLFHSQLPHEDKQEALKKFRNDDDPVVFATSAFGMGINRSDVRQIVHYETPITLIDYAQQIGRGGRDGLPTLCTTFHDRNSYEMSAELRLTFLTPDYDFVERVYRKLCTQLEKLAPKKRKAYNLKTFSTQTQLILERNSDFADFQINRYMEKLMISLALLQNSGYIHEGRDGLTLHEIEHGSPRHLKLIEKTEMHRRMQVRETARIAEFFKEPTLDQQKLWDIIRKN